jgi:hypothetical protein
VTCYTQPCKLCKVICILHYLSLGDESSPRRRWVIYTPALPDVLTLVPLTELVSPVVKYKWGEEQQKAFDEIKQKVSKATLFGFPDFGKEFHVYTDACNMQVGAVIMQE